MEQIQREHQQHLERMQARMQTTPLRPDDEPLDMDDLYGQAKVCIACRK